MVQPILSETSHGPQKIGEANPKFSKSFSWDFRARDLRMEKEKRARMHRTLQLKVSSGDFNVTGNPGKH